MDLPIPMWWAEFDHKLRIQKRLQKDQGSSSKGLGAFSEADWAEARRRHREKVNGN